MRFAAIVCLVAQLVFAQSATVDQLFQNAVQAQQHGDLDTAIRDYQRVIELQPKFFDAEVNLAVALVHEGRFDEAIRHYRAALQLQPSNAAVRLNLGLAYYKKNDPADAAAIFAALRK